MPAYKESNGTWTIRYKIKNWENDIKEVKKRGFRTKKEALAWEIESKASEKGKISMTFERFVNDYYYPTVQKRIKYSTFLTKQNMIDNYLIPFFGEKALDAISTADVLSWQNNILSLRKPGTDKPFAKSYIKSIHVQLSTILNFGCKYFGLKINVASLAGNMGDSHDTEMDFWTWDEYQKFREVMQDEPLYFYAFEVLYFCGLREGEMLALTAEDFNFENNTISITKTFHHLKGKDYITSPKTPQSIRTVDMPETLAEELKEYVSYLYKPNNNDRVFLISKSMLLRAIKRGAKKAGIKQIRVHDLRHSHISLLIHMGYDAVAIGKRVGHKAVDITFHYAHMFPKVGTDIAQKLDSIMNSEDKDIS